MKLWRLDLIYILCKYLFRPTRASIRKTSRWMLHRKIIVVYCKNHTENIDTLYGKDAEAVVLNKL